MSMDPNQMQQMLAFYKAQFPGQLAMGMGNAPAGTNAGAGDVNAMSKLAMALMQRNNMKKYSQQYPQQLAVPPSPSQGQTLSFPGMSVAPGGGGGTP